MEAAMETKEMSSERPGNAKPAAAGVNKTKTEGEAGIHRLAAYS
jgi:hypothetical protein